MELRALELLITDEDLTSELGEHLPDHAEVKDLRVRVTPEGVHVSGVYPTLMLAVHFDTFWTVALRDGAVEARLGTIQVAGWDTPGPLRAVIWGMVRDSVPKLPGVSVGEDAIRVAVEEALAARGVSLRLTLKAIECGSGGLLVRA